MSILESQAEAFIIQRVRVTPCTLAKELQCVTAEMRVMLSNIVSQLVIKNNWRTEHINNRLFIIAETPVNKEHKSTTMTHAKAIDVCICPKHLPCNGDWIVTSVDPDCNTRLYFDKDYTRDEARGSFAKSEKVKKPTTRICRYKKIVPLKEMHNFL